MTPDRWERVQELFEKAMDRPAGERAAFLSEACGADASLQTEVASLISADEKAGDFISTPALGAGFVLPNAEALLDEEVARPMRERIGAYRVVRLIASGGVGAVYLVERDDGQFQKRAAIKCIRHGIDSQSVLDGFQRERALLARLEHPNIAGLLDAGVAEDGLPYLVMEYVEGRPIDRYCDEECLSISDRLQLFGTVCSAVQYAHQKLIVHCDLKPSNILVTADGVPKLLDFGIARILNPEISGHSLHPTTVPPSMMTPDYASPEQIRGEPLSTSSDVYSLGVVLYELLTGHRPHRLRTRVRQEIERTICEQLPSAPSESVQKVEEICGPDGTVHTRHTPESVSAVREGSAHKLCSRLSGDLDNIVLMSLRKEPQRRYSSVEHLAEDIERHLNGLPVHARKDTFGYRAAKFVRRNRGGVLAGCVAVLALMVALVGMSWQARSLAVQRDEAETQRGLAEANLRRAQEMEARYAIEADIAMHNAEMARTSTGQADAINAFLRTMLNSVKPGNEGTDVTVLEVLELAASRVEWELAEQPVVEAAVRQTIGQAYHSLGRYDRAEHHLRESVALYRGSLDETVRDLTSVAHSYKALGDVLRDKGQYDESETMYREALATFRELLEPEHRYTAAALTALARLVYEKGDHAEAERLCEQALMSFDTPIGSRPSLESADDQHVLGTLLQFTGDWTRAEQSYRNALLLRRLLLREDHPDVADSLHSLATVLVEKGDLNEAESLLREALDIQRKTLPPEHPGIATTLVVLADVLTKTGKSSEAEELAREGLTIRVAALGRSHWLTAEAQSVLGGCLAGQGRYGEAGPMLVESLPAIRTDCGEEHERTVSAIQRIIEFYELQGQVDSAAKYRHLLSAAGANGSTAIE